MEIGPCVNEEEAARKRLAWSPQPMMSGHQVAAVQSQRDITEKSVKNPEKGLLHRENAEKEEKAQRKPGKEKVSPNSHTVSQRESAGPSVRGAGGPERRVVNPRVLVATTEPEVESGSPP